MNDEVRSESSVKDAVVTLRRIADPNTNRGDASHHLYQHEAAALLELLNGMAFEHVETNKFEHARNALAEALR